MDDIGPETDWSGILQDVDAVVHLAARVHMIQELAPNLYTLYQQMNVDATRRLAEQSEAAGVHRFVFLSSIGVHGAINRGQPCSEKSHPAPYNHYTQSKWQAEQLLQQIATESAMQVTVLRPPLVYGPRVPANFLALMRLVDRGIPLPLGAVQNQRSLIYLGNLVSAIQHCLEHPDADGQTFVVSDGDDVSTPELIRRLARALGKPARLLPVSTCWLLAAARLTGKMATLERLTGSLLVDSRHIRQELSWQPPFTMDEGLVETARWFRLAQAKGAN